MRVLWIANNMLESVAVEAERKAGFGGGWIPSMANRIKEQPDIRLSIVVFGNCKTYKCIEKEDIRYHIFPYIRTLRFSGGGKKAIKTWRKIIKSENPDVIHIYGTEQPTSIELIKNYSEIPTIVSLQGIISEYYKYYYGDMEFLDVAKSITIVDILLGSSGYFGRKKFKRNSRFENIILKSVKYVEGRTSWDKCVVKNINKDVKYYSCNRILRKDFYEAEKWDIKNIDRHTIFVHQGNYSIKGLHMLVKAVGVLKDKYPDITIRIAGQDPTKKNGLKGKVAVNGYSKYVKRQAQKARVYEKMDYVGHLDAKGVVDMLNKSHIMIVPSSIENSPNSLAEGMILGVPCVASYVGGNAEMLENGKAGLLYPFNDYILLAHKIDEIFSNDDLAHSFSTESIRIALNRHNPDKLVSNMISIYRDITKA